jgi:hypothetical protein
MQQKTSILFVQVLRRGAEYVGLYTRFGCRKSSSRHWVVDEVRLAVDKGERLMEVYEFYEYEITQYDPTTGEGGLFVQYTNTFLKLKAEASG